MQKFLIIQTAFTGDVVLATGILEKLHRFFPDAQIDFLLRKGNEGLLADHPFLNEVLVWDKKNRKWPNLFNLLSLIRKRKYDRVINLQRFASTGFLTAFSKGRERTGFDKNPFSFLFTKKIRHVINDGRHEIERNNELIQDFTDSIAEKPRLHPTRENENFISQYTVQPYICIAPSSVWYTKQFHKSKWTEFINTIPLSYKIFLLGAPGDREFCDEIRSSCGQNAETLAGKLNYLQSAALMKGAVMNYVNDSAPLHFASAMNAPVTAIFCSTIPLFGFGPLSERSFIVETKEKLDCKPCTLHGRTSCPLGHFKCALTIETNQLTETLS
jgi:heptosyltransferase-2